MSRENPFANYKNVDWENCVAAGSSAAKAISESLKGIYHLQTEIARRNTEAFTSFVTSASSTKNPEASLAKNVDYTKKTLKSASVDLQDLTKAFVETQKEISNILLDALPDGSSKSSKGSKKAA